MNLHDQIKKDYIDMLEKIKAIRLEFQEKLNDSLEKIETINMIHRDENGKPFMRFKRIEPIKVTELPDEFIEYSKLEHDRLHREDVSFKCDCKEDKK